MGKQFNTVNASRGAPMGRRADGYLETGMARFVRLFRVRLDSGGYDDGGAYWGIGESLYCAIDDDGNHQFTRAASRERAAFLLDISSLALKRSLHKNGVDYGLALLDGRAPMPSDKTRDDVISWLRACGHSFG